MRWVQQRALWVVAIVICPPACQSSLIYYGDKGEDLGIDSGSTSTDEIDTTDPTDGTSDNPSDATDTTTDSTTDTDSDADVDSDADSDSDTDSDADADSDSDTDSDADTDTGTPPPPLPLVDGHFVGSVTVYYEINLPVAIGGGSSNCNGDIDITVDQTLTVNPYSAITGTMECNWPILDLWATVLMGLDDVNGSIEGSVSGSVVTGSTSGADGNGVLSWSDVWTGVGNGTTLTGSFSDTSFPEGWGFDFDAQWVGP